MCGRFVNLNKINSLKKNFNINSSVNKNLLSYNIAPSQTSYIILKNKIVSIEEAKWGFSFFDKNENKEKNIINSRLETINNKILFKESYFKRKCIIPVNGYYEWSLKENKKIPYFINIPHLETMYFAGIWKYSNFQKNNQKVFSIITKDANINISKIHSRMPVILSNEEGEYYLNDNNSSFLQTDFLSKIESELDFYEVSNFVNSPLNDSLKCIKSI